MALAPLNTSYVLGLYGLDPSSAATTGGTAAPKRVAPTAPWSKTPTPQEASANLKAALAGRKFVDEDAAQLDLKGASGDYRKLFALYQGLSTLSDVATRMESKGLSGVDKAQINRAFVRGMAELSAYIDKSQFEQLRLAQGEAATSVKAGLTAPKAKTEYITKPITDSTSEPVAALEGQVSFTIAVKRLNVTHYVAIDLAGMGGAPRTIGNVINYINDQLAAEGLETRVLTHRIPAQPRKVQVNGKEITLPPGADQWALKVKMGTSEAVRFDAPRTGAVYVAQSVGNPDPDGKASTNDGVTQRELLKFQTAVTPSTPAPLQGEGEANWVEGRIFAQTLAPEIKTVRSQAVAADGSVYMLADVTGKPAGQVIKGEQDTALLKYDSAGKLIYARTLGAADSATGLALAVSSDGKVAVAGSVTGVLGGATDGVMNSGPASTASDSFVTVFDDKGDELWTQRRGARLEDEASQLAFGADGTVYVAGRTRSAMPGAAAIGGWDSYVEAFKPDTAGKVQTLFTQTFGTAASDRPAGLVVDGNALVTASVEDGRGVLRRFDLTSGTPVLAATRDLGDLMGGDIAGLALDAGTVVVAGTTANTALAAGGVTHAHAGGTDAFAARLSASLAPAAGDRIAYYGGAGDDRAVSLAVGNGQVFIGGSAGTDLPGEAAMGVKDGFVARLDIATGAVGWSQRFTGKDGRATPTAIAVDPNGASVLDRLGLPQGELQLGDSDKVTSLSSVRPGDQFTVQVGAGRTSTVTIEGKDTLDTLAQKIRRASGFQAKVTLTTVNGARQMKIEPINPRFVIEIGPGKTDKDALAMLGIPEGVVRTTITQDGQILPGDRKPKIYGLGLPSDLNLSNPEQVRHAMAEIGSAMGIVRSAYKDLVAAATPKTGLAAAQASAGPAPAYLTNQIANYQAALNRLTGGG
ncbi:hypothetical protein [Phenylobacterium sp.]|jgi:hypothetical protein|uniref:hypothetical protein n=1 Tax=Phenylobacterium sp. TaxID=1871053 RepID=UPI002F927012